MGKHRDYCLIKLLYLESTGKHLDCEECYKKDVCEALKEDEDDED